MKVGEKATLDITAFVTQPPMLFTSIQTNLLPSDYGYGAR